jgi:Phosphoribosyl transferase (PRTase)
VTFGSYRPDEVTWLLTDLSHVDLEVATEDREELIQGGRPYYEMLPVEYQPDPAYSRLFHEALDDSAERVAVAVGLVAELVLAAKPAPVLVSLARAGTSCAAGSRATASTPRTTP